MEQIKEVPLVKPETVEKIKFGIWGLIYGAIVAIVIGFAWGGWVTSSTNQKMSGEAAFLLKLPRVAILTEYA
jgi:hypothetical protein